MVSIYFVFAIILIFFPLCYMAGIKYQKREEVKNWRKSAHYKTGVVNIDGQMYKAVKIGDDASFEAASKLHNYFKKFG